MRYDVTCDAITKSSSAPLLCVALPLVWEGPFEVETRFFFTDEADMAAQQPGVERVDDQTVCFRGEDIREIIYR